MPGLRKMLPPTIVLLTALFPIFTLDATAIEADVCVYGGTSGGVVAAVQAARMGKRVVLVEPGRHLGGMTSGGLSAVDIGDPRSIGGIAREYFTRLVATYDQKLDWGQPFQGTGGPPTGGAYSIEPHVAERVFDEMVAEAGVRVLREARLQRVRKDGARIGQLYTEDGRTIAAKMFIDATYEGDLMAAAGVNYTLMREGNAKYGEQYNGIHYTKSYEPRVDHKQPRSNGRVPGGQGVWDRDFPLDPYVVKGDASSGLLPLLNQGDPGVQGEPAAGIMAYCFRLCLTTDQANLIPIAPPESYDPQRYELVARFIEACLANGDQMDLRWFSKHDPLPHSKWDSNTATFGGNLPGANWGWPEASYDQRVLIAKEIEDYHRGLLHFLATDSRVPQRVRDDVKRFGLPKDEFRDNGGWPHQLYVREGRRMVSDLVLTEHHTFGRKIAPHSIGLGSYGTDVHEIRRIVKDGVVAREGKVAGGRGGFGPYQIGYGAIVPKQSECENLFVTFALSASHTALASIRMEPVLMVTSQSAATAACQAIDADVAVQRIDYRKLKAKLTADGQVLAWNVNGEQASRRRIQPSASTAPQPLWDASSEVPVASDLNDIQGIQFHVIKKHEPESDRFDWLHGVALAWHGDRIYASYGHNHGKENTASEIANYSISFDGGKHWSDPKLIDDGREDNLAVSHGVFLRVAGKLWAFHGAFYGRMQDIHTRAYSLDDATNEWIPHGVVVSDGFWPMQEPQRMADGNWVMSGLQVVAGISNGNNPAAVAISHGDDLLNWDLVSIPKSPAIDMWGESTVIVDGATLLNVSRYRRPTALVSSSHDFGRTWTTMAESNLPMAASKPYSGILSTGQRYLIGNTTADNDNRRWPLTIAVSKPHENQFDRVYRIRAAIHDGPGESKAKCGLSYPYAVEHDGNLYVGYSNNGGRGGNRNSAELAIIPVASLDALR